MSEALEGEVVHDALVYEKMRMKKPDLTQPYPNWPEYFGNTKEDIVGLNPNPEYAMMLDEYMSVSKMSMRFYIAAKLPMHYLELSIAFSGCPRLG